MARSSVLLVKAPTIDLRYDADPLTSSIGVTLATASRAASSSSPGVNSLPFRIPSALVAKIGVGATQPRDIFTSSQKFPSFRVQLPGNIAVAKPHTDHSLGHPIGEINFTYTFTDMYDTNSIFIFILSNDS